MHQIRLDCDNDVVLLKVTQLGHEPGIACHTGRHSCFFQQLDGGQWKAVEPVLKDPKSHLQMSDGNDSWRALAAVIESRKPPTAAIPTRVMSRACSAKGTDAILKKVGEEATETVMAAKDGDRARRPSTRWPTCGSTR